MHKRFGLSYETIEEGVKQGTLKDMITSRSEEINKSFEISVKGENKIVSEDAKYVLEIKATFDEIFIHEGAKELRYKNPDYSEGGVKDRIKLVQNDPDKEYAIYYKPIDHQKSGVPVLGVIEGKYWLPFKIKCTDGEKWILLNKSSLRKRFRLSESNIDWHLQEKTLMGFLAREIQRIDEPEKFYKHEIKWKENEKLAADKKNNKHEPPIKFI